MDISRFSNEDSLQSFLTIEEWLNWEEAQGFVTLKDADHLCCYSSVCTTSCSLPFTVYHATMETHKKAPLLLFLFPAFLSPLPFLFFSPVKKYVFVLHPFLSLRWPGAVEPESLRQRGSWRSGDGLCAEEVSKKLKILRILGSRFLSVREGSCKYAEEEN